MTETNIPASVDYAIIGGGLAGCTLASRLRQYNPSLSILLIEAGPDPTGHPLIGPPLACFAAHYSELDWNYTTVPQPGLGGRATYASGGKVLSGGTATNYGTWTRGPSVDYDYWAKAVGDPAWSYEGLLPYFKKTETHWGKGDEEDAQHGFKGPIHNVSISASSDKRKYPLREKVRDAWTGLGVKYVTDANGGNPLGIAETVENWRDGKRQCASQAYDLSGVQVMTNTLVHRVVIEDRDGNKTAIGVQLADGRTVHTTKEVIVSAGAYRTPQVLMLSGIGPSTELAKFGIPLVLDNSEVGQNFFDHLDCFMWWKLRHPEQGLSAGTPLWTDPAFQMGFPNDWLVSEHAPDEQMKAALLVDGDTEDKHNLLDPARCHSESIIAYAAGGTSFADVKNVPFDGTHISSVVVGMLPTSRGSITISSTNPADPPVIDPNFYATEADRAAMRAALRQVMRLFQDTPEGREMVETEVPPQGSPKLTVNSTDEEIDARVKRVGNTIYHPAGSAAMGKVVDSELRIIGIERLRVVDASVMPVSICAHYQVPMYAIAEKAADLISQR
jgi:choline dehydrogenase-like flavoprotein